MRFIMIGLMSVGLLAGQAAHAADVAASGSFTGASNHITTGTIEVIKADDGYQIILGDDFSLDGAPDPKLGFGTDGKYDDSTTFAVLDNLTGKQTYALPTTIDPAAHNEFYIWCEKFAVPLGVAKLTR